MPLNTRYLSYAIFAISAPAFADCTDIISLSRVQTAIIQSASDIDQYANQFCKEYESSKKNGASMEASASYKFFSASYGQASMSAEDIASKHCEATNIGKAKSSSYQTYVNTIAPDAFGSYNRCVELEKEDIYINVDRTTVLENYFNGSVSLKTSAAKSLETLAFAASPGVTCKWDIGTGKQVDLTSDRRTAVFTCGRTDSTKDSAVLIYVATRPNSQLSYKWSSYKDGLPQDILGKLAKQIESANAALEATNSSLRSSVTAFASATCPLGWDEYKPAYGRFIRGIDKIGGTDVEFNRTFGSLQLDAFQAHNHEFSSPVTLKAHGPNSQAPHGYMNGGYGLPIQKTDKIVDFPPHGSVRPSTETRPVNVALLYCIRK